jgi:hypothetical protein
MARYFDHFEQTWAEKPIVKHAWASGYRIRRPLRRELIRLLQSEIDGSADPLVEFYALMLARRLCQTDLELMEEFGRWFGPQYGA